MHELGLEFDSLIQNDLILPSQFYDGHHRADPYQGEKRLWFEVMESALKGWRFAHGGASVPISGWDGKNKGAQRLRMRVELTDWFEADAYYPGSFTWLCELFGLDVAAVRRRVFGHQVGSLKREMVHSQVTPVAGRGRSNVRRRRRAA